MKSIEKISRDMCSTPVSVDDGVCDNTSSSSISSNDDTFNDCYSNILWELEKLESIRNSREECIQRFLRVLCNIGDDSKLDFSIGRKNVEWCLMRERYREYYRYRNDKTFVGFAICSAVN